RHETPDAVARKCAGAEPGDQTSRGNAGNEEEECKPKGAERAHEGLGLGHEAWALQVIAPGHVEHPDMEQDQEPAGRHPEPVEEVFALTHRRSSGLAALAASSGSWAVHPCESSGLLQSFADFRNREGFR